MSDTDDTDLLLLIPPDFYLIHSPDLSKVDSDSDIDVGVDAKEIKDLIVSDLIHQVNDLEGRICMIENLERSVTHCSTCNEDSFANQSLNSLTESDVLRYHITGKRELSTEKLMFCPTAQDSKCEATSLVQENLTGLQIEPYNVQDSSEHAQPIVDYKTSLQNISKPSSIIEQENLACRTWQNEDCPERVVKLRKNPQELLNEVDCFLGVKNKHKFTGIVVNDTNYENKLEKNVQSKEENVTYKIIDDFNSKQKYSPELKFQEPEQSLPLPKVYELLKEMEETQHEIEQKLKRHQLQPPSEESGECRNIPVVNNTKLHNFKTLELEDLYTKSPISGVINPIENVERLKQFQGIKHQIIDSTHQPTMGNSTQVNYLFKPSSALNEERPTFDRNLQIKTLSPNRIQGNLNPIDIVKANLPRSDSKSIASLEGTKHSPRKFSGFRRQLNFEKQDFSIRSSKSRPSLSIEQTKTNQNCIQENDRGRLDFIHGKSRRLDSNNKSIEEQFKAMAIQRASNDNINPNAYLATENKLSTNEIPQQKISSNNLLSLSELWNKEPTFYSDDPNKLRQKLEEEKYRRQHCEQQIQVLQLRVLEEQEKLAVAIRVDQEKDKAIVQITESWRRLNDHWGELEDQRHSLAQQLQEERELAKVKSNELTKKAERWEKEVSQALDLAAGYKEKSEAVQSQMESLKRDTEEKLAEMRNELQNLKQENKKICDENTDFLEQLESFQERLKEEEDLLTKLKIELEKSKKQISDNEAEICVITEQKETLSLMLEGERNRNNMLEQQKIAFQQALNEAVKKEKAAEEEARVSSERVEVARTELRAFYQGQLESVVKDKLQEFQSQLEAAETALKSELQLKERQWSEKASEQCKQLRDRYKKDMQMLEESRKEEENKWKMKLMESEKLRSIAESKLQEETNRRADIAQRLHSVMETQWREALNIISNPMQNMYETTKEENRGRRPPSQQGSERGKPCWTNSSASLVQAEDPPFCKEGVVTYRPSQPVQESHLKKYIEMLLERGPGNPVPHHDSMQDSLDQTFAPDDSPPSNKWFMEHTKKQSGQVERFGQSSKPPWK